MADCECVPLIGQQVFTPEEIVIYGLNLVAPPPPNTATLRTGPGYTLDITPSGPGGPIFEIVAAYGYSYEGSCFRFDPFRVIIFRRDAMYGSGAIPPDENACGFKPPYWFWRVPTTAYLLEIGTKVGRFERLVLESNLPGQRSPDSYRSHMQVAHRGRLTGA
jgi:hypothetical protein